MFVYFMFIPLIFLINSSRMKIWFLFYGFIYILKSMFHLFKTNEVVYSNHFAFWSEDVVSNLLIILSILVILLSGLVMMEGGRMHFMLVSFFFSVFFLIVFFGSDNLLNFLVFFELSMLPIFMLIGFWGKGKERVFSNYYFFLYTLVTSLPMFIMILKITSIGMESIVTYSFYDLNFTWFMFFLLVLGFLTKLPIYGVHIWLPKAHVDAPVGGSMVLAGILLKIGGFGMMRCMMILGDGMKLSYIVMFIMFLGVWGLFFTGSLCLRLTDFKVIVAFSSVSHMSLAVAGLMSFFFWGYKGSFYMFLGHGILSPVLFFFGDILYKRFSTRHINSMKGISSGVSFFFYLVMLFFFAMNFGFPPSMNFFGEVGLFMSIFLVNKFLILFLFIGFLMAGVFMLNMFVMLGQSKKMIKNKMILLSYEKMVMMYFFISYFFISFFLVWIF
uniref:NADH-ubiquinone oxidoreductase chain 4 n=1 Tax=Ciona savignyi TaxID=51511 RepID=Q85UH2_CIOSA|nr:NADH dehydrogenase subunit 4 [Ciona savignyi]BAC57011.1 NADH dehydrogenase subunit 4 [Ciona savignyi]